MMDSGGLGERMLESQKNKNKNTETSKGIDSMPSKCLLIIGLCLKCEQKEIVSPIVV